MDDRSNEFKLVKYTVYLWQSKNDNIYTSGNYELKQYLNTWITKCGSYYCC